MNREEFLNRLEYLLQDISEEDKRDALDYYRDYLEEAGPENEQEVLAEFESPERIAAIIRTDLLGGMDQAGEFTDSGYEDERFRRRAYPAVPPEASQGKTEREGSSGKDKTAGRSGNGETQSEPWNFDSKKSAGRRGRQGESQSGSYADGRAERERDSDRSGSWVKYLLIALLILVIAPLLIALGAGVFGILAGVCGVLLAMVLVLALLTFCGFLVGAIFVVVGIGTLFADLWLGVFCIGAGLIGLGAGCLLLICAYLFYGKFLPWVVMGIINAASDFLNRKKKREKDNAEWNGEC